VEILLDNSTGANIFPKIALGFPLKIIIAQMLQTHMAKFLSSGAAATDPPNFTVWCVRFLFHIQEVWDSNIGQNRIS
jgi:hypothetical protein